MAVQKKWQIQHKPTGSRRYPWLYMLIAVVIVCLCLGVYLADRQTNRGDSIFQRIVRDGYGGTQEQWLASLVGEEVQASVEKSAYQLACEKGYQKSEQEWMKTLTGNSDVQTGTSPYQSVCRNGYSGSLAQWLESIADAPERLGISSEGEETTGYELACEYGYNGSFIEWLISAVCDPIHQ